MMTPVGRLVLIRSTPRSELVSAMAWLTIPRWSAPGRPTRWWLHHHLLTWHWIFLINVPIGFVGIWFATRFLPDTEERIVKRLDWTGFFLSGMAMSGVVFGLSVVSLPALPPAVGFTTLAIGIVCTVLYFRHAKRVDDPLLNLKLFDNQVFRSAVIGGSIFRFGIGAIPFLLPLMFQLGFGLTPFQSGMMTFVSAIGAISMKFGAKRIFVRVGFRRALMAGSLISACFIAVNGFFTPTTPYWIIIGFCWWEVLRAHCSSRVSMRWLLPKYQMKRQVRRRRSRQWRSRFLLPSVWHSQAVSWKSVRRYVEPILNWWTSTSASLWLLLFLQWLFCGLRDLHRMQARNLPLRLS